MQENAESRQECGVCNGTGMPCCSLSAPLLLSDACKTKYWLWLFNDDSLVSPEADAISIL